MADPENRLTAPILYGDDAAAISPGTVAYLLSLASEGRLSTEDHFRLSAEYDRQSALAPTHRRVDFLELANFVARPPPRKRGGGIKDETDERHVVTAILVKLALLREPTRPLTPSRFDSGIFHEIGGEMGITWTQARDVYYAQIEVRDSAISRFAERMFRAANSRP
jgi:hypothetical protein